MHRYHSHTANEANQSPAARQQGRRAYSLLELVLAIALVGGTLAPAMSLIRSGLELSETTDQKALLANYAVSKIEEHLAIVAATWTSGTASGNFATDGFSSLRYEVTRSDAVADGGIVDELMHVQVTTFFDVDGDTLLDADEPQCHYRTKIGKFASYESIASP
ncbi:MAG: hypothetical protein AAGF31_04620 [Planctomycetota bacterium]